MGDHEHGCRVYQTTKNVFYKGPHPTHFPGLQQVISRFWVKDHCRHTPWELGLIGSKRLM